MPQAAVAIPYIMQAAAAAAAIAGTVSSVNQAKRAERVQEQSQLATKIANQKEIDKTKVPEYKPVRPAAITTPSNVANELAGFSPEQTRSALANKGLQGGLGNDEANYYKNLISRSLIGDNNQVTGNTDSLLPVESQYFSKQGINTSNIMDFLRQIQPK